MPIQQFWLFHSPIEQEKFDGLNDSTMWTAFSGVECQLDFALANLEMKLHVSPICSQTKVWSHTSWHLASNSYDDHSAKEWFSSPTRVPSVHDDVHNNN